MSKFGSLLSPGVPGGLDTYPWAQGDLKALLEAQSGGFKISPPQQQELRSQQEQRLIDEQARLVEAERRRALIEAQRRRGRRASILTSGSGVTDPLGSVSRPEARASDFLG